MKKARLILSASMLSIAAFSAVTFTSCSKDDDCAAGYEGKDCSEEIRAAMIGTYNATDVDVEDNTPYAYNPVVTKNTGSVTVINIANFGDFFTNTEIVTSNVTKSGNIITFTIPAQKPDDVYEVSGSGTFNTETKKVDIQYALDNGIEIKNYTGTWTKQ